MRLAFALDGLREHAGVVLRQDDAGTVQGQVDGAQPDSVGQVERQVARILSLDHDGEAWLGVGKRDPVIGGLQRRHLGLRPVLFNSPYEAAAWGLISARQGMRQASAVRERIAARLGRRFELEGRELHAFPLPPALATLESEQGLSSVKAERLRALADRAVQLDIDRLRAMPADDALVDVQTIDGIGPFYASLVVVRACGLADAPAYEPLVARPRLTTTGSRAPRAAPNSRRSPRIGGPSGPGPACCCAIPARARA